MYFYCIAKPEGILCNGRGKNKSTIKFDYIKEAIPFAKEFSIKNQKTCEIYRKESDSSDIKDKKVISYRRGELIYFNIR